MRAFCLRGEISVAYKLFNQMFKRDILPDIESYRILMQGLCRKSQVNGAVDLLEDMLNKAKGKRKMKRKFDLMGFPFVTFSSKNSKRLKGMSERRDCNLCTAGFFIKKFNYVWLLRKLSIKDNLFRPFFA